ncbi:MAG: hypothetical protein Q8Q32_03040 [bacterium]|nr:hypothetical protein [bacterium]
MRLFKKSKPDLSVSEVGGRSTKLLVAGIILSVFLVLYVVLSMRFLSREVGTAFADFADRQSGPLKYHFEAFERIFPEKLDELKAELEQESANESTSATPSPDSGVGASTTTSTAEATSSEEVLVDPSTSSGQAGQAGSEQADESS